jgi:hypothetical protein
VTDEPTEWGVLASFRDSVLWPNAKKGPWRVWCQWANVNGYARLVGVTVESEMVQKGNKLTLETLTASVYRDLPLDHVADLVLQKIRREQDAFNVGPADPDGITGRHVRGGRTGRPPLTPDDLARVAAIYRAGGTRPTAAVADALNISRSAAAKRVARARAAGLLERTTQGRAGGPVIGKKARKR